MSRCAWTVVAALLAGHLAVDVAVARLWSPGGVPQLAEAAGGEMKAAG